MNPRMASSLDRCRSTDFSSATLLYTTTLGTGTPSTAAKWGSSDVQKTKLSLKSFAIAVTHSRAGS